MSAPKPVTQAERLTRIETILESAFGHDGTIPAMAKDIKSVKDAVDADVADLARLKHRGAGILVGISLTCTTIGVVLSSWIKDIFKAIF